MSTTEPATPMTVLSLFRGDTDTDDVVASMERHLPPDGMATGRVRGRFDLARATYRLLDSRILEAAAKSLNQDIAKPLARWLGTFQNLREAAAKTGSGTENDVLVTLGEPTPFTSTQGSDVVLSVGEEKVATIGFRLELTLELGKTDRRHLLLADGEHDRSEEHTSELQSPVHLVCRLLLEKKKD